MKPWERDYGGGDADSSAKPWEKNYSAKPPRSIDYSSNSEPESPTSFGNLVGAATEPALSMASGAVTGPLSGLAGIAGTMMPGPPGQGAEWARGVGGMQYEPRSTGGKNAMSAISAPFEMVNKGARYAGEKTQDLTGSPLAATGVQTGLEALAQLAGAKGGRMGARGFDRVMDNIGPELGLRKPPGMPPARPDVMDLDKRGVPLTPGMINPGLKRIEESAKSIPFFGDSVRSAEGRAVESVNREAWNDALKPIGAKLPNKMIGQEAAEFAREAYEDAYRTLHSKMKGALDLAPPRNPNLPPTRGTFRQELNKILDEAKQDLGPREMRELRRIVEKEVKDRFNGRGASASGEQIQAISEKLRTERKSFERGDPYQRRIGEKLKLVEDSMDKMLSDQNPSYAKDKSRIDDGYARFKIAQNAAGRVGAKEGVFKPSQYDSAVRAKDSSKDKRAFAEGNARQQDLSGPAKRVLADELPDSGTPFRLSSLKALADPIAALKFASAVGIPVSVLYSPMGIKLMQEMAMGRGPQVGRGMATALPIGAAAPSNNPPPQ